MSVRRATSQDIAAIVEFNLQMAWETEDKRLDRDVLRRGVAAVCDDSQRGFYVVAEVDTEIVACMMITFEWSDWRNGYFWWIQSVFVRRQHRRRGIYRRMYEFVRQLSLESSSVCGFRLYVEQNNAIAKKTYDDLGMSLTPYRIYEAAPPQVSQPD